MKILNRRPDVDRGIDVDPSVYVQDVNEILDDPEIDIYQGAWGVGSDVDPSGLYGPTAPFNYTRYESDESTELLTAGNSQEALEVDYRKDVYNQWAELMVQDIPVIPTLYRAFVTPVNERVINYSEDYQWNEDTLWYRVGVEDAE